MPFHKFYTYCLIITCTIPSAKSAQNSSCYNGADFITVENTQKIIDAGKVNNDGGFALFLAIEYNKTDVVRLLVENGADVNILNEKGDTPLHLAVRRGCSIEIINLLAKRVLFIELPNKDLDTPLHLAIRCGCSMEIINLLAKKMLFIELPNKDLDTPLHLAIRRGCIKVVKYLVGQGAGVSLCARKNKHGNTPLDLALNLNRIEIIKYFLGKSKDLNIVKNKDITFLQLALESGNLELVNFVLKNSGNIHTLIGPALEYKNFELAKFLINKGANINIPKNQYCEKILSYLKLQYESIEYLIESKVNINNHDVYEFDQYKSLQLAVKSKDLKLVKFLIKNGTSLYAQDYNVNNVLHYAVRYGDLEMVKFLILEKGMDVNSEGDDFNTPLHYAVDEGHIEVVKFLIASGADINAKKWDPEYDEQSGDTPLQLVIQSDWLEIVKFILEHQTSVYSPQNNMSDLLHYAANYGASEIVEFFILEQGMDIHSKDEDENNLLHSVLKFLDLHKDLHDGHLDLIQFLVASKVDVNAKSKYLGTPLRLVIRFKHLDLIEFFVENGANVNAKDQDEDRCTPLELAAMSGSFEIVKFLLANGANINVYDSANPNRRTKLVHCAASSENLELVKFFVLEKGMDIHSKDRYGDTPLHSSLSQKNLEIPKFLIANGADVNVKGDYMKTPLHLAVNNRYFELVKLLVANGASVNAENDVGETPLHLAVNDRYFEIVKFLVENGANVNTQNQYGCTPLALAAISGSFEIVKFLLANGANINVYGSENPHRRSTLLHYAASSGNLELVKFFVLEKKMDIHSKDKHGNTPLHRSVSQRSRKNLEVSKFLIANGVDVNAENDEGETPLYLALDNHYFELIKFLVLEKKADIHSKDKHGNSLLKRMVNAHYYFLDKESIQIAGFLVENGLSDGKEVFLKKMMNYIIKECRSCHSDSGIERYKLAISYFLSNGTDPNKVIGFDSLKIDLKPLLDINHPYIHQDRVKFQKTILDTFYHAHRVQTITAGYIRTQSEQEGLYVPRDISSIISKHTYKDPIKLKSKNLEILKSTLVWLGTMIKT